MGGADKVEARRQEEQEQRKPKKLNTGQAMTSKTDPVQVSSDTIAEDDDTTFEMEQDQDFHVVTKTMSNQHRTELSFYIAEVSRYGISDRAAAALYNAAC